MPIEIEVAIENMMANADLYRKIANAKYLENDDIELALASARMQTWTEAADLLKDAYGYFKIEKVD